jgi:hypothetical protein
MRSVTMRPHQYLCDGCHDICRTHWNCRDFPHRDCPWDGTWRDTGKQFPDSQRLVDQTFFDDDSLPLQGVAK